MGAKYIASKCPIEELLVLIGGRWKPVILKALWDNAKPLRFKLLRERIPVVSQKILTKQLRELERDGFVKREKFFERPMRVEYSLTASGNDLGPVLLMLDAWMRKHLQNRQHILDTFGRITN
jgi:DNA-binding HxlR family transcriptional regulator